MSSAIVTPNNAPLPVETPIVAGYSLDYLRRVLRDPANQEKDYGAHLISAPWANALSQLSLVQAQTPQRVASEILTNQSASIGLTALPTPGNSGVYRFTYTGLVEVADGVSSSLIVTVTFTYNGAIRTYSGAAINGDTTSTWGSETKQILVDANTPIDYSTTYASNTPAQMKYGLVVILEAVQL